MTVYKPKNEIATIDCSLITISHTVGSGSEAVVEEIGSGSEAVVEEIGFDTANQIEVEVQTEEEDAVKLVVKGKLRAQKPKETTITGNEITLHDNVFNPELVLILQGGTIAYSQTTGAIESYTPPVAGSDDHGESFELNAYSAQYNAAGQIVNYEKITYPNCKGQPVAFSAEDGSFRAPEYVIDSAPNTGEAPYTITWVDELPTLTTRS